MTDIATLGLRVDSTGLRQGSTELDRLAATGERTEQRVSRSTGAMNAGMARLARGAGVVAGALAAAFSARAVITGIAQFEASTARLGAISGATAAQMREMRDVALDLGASTEFSATQAADALTFLSMAGFSAAESMASIPAVLDLATASGMGLAQAADVASNIMSGFGIEAANAASVADVLAAASSRANTSVSQLGQAMATVAPISAALNIGIEDTAAAIGILSDAGIQGERAGTALRGVLASLAGPTTQARQALALYGLTAADVDVSSRSLADVLQTLADAGISTADAMTIFGREAASGALVLTGSARRVADFGRELRGVQGAASDMATQIRDNLQGDIDSLTSAVAGLIIAMGDAGLTAVLRSLVQIFTGVVRGVAAVVEGFGRIARAAAQATRDILGLGMTHRQVAEAMDTVAQAAREERAAIGDLSDRMEPGSQVTLRFAQSKLRQAEAHYAVLEAMQEEARGLILQSAEYQEQARRVEDIQRAMRSLRGEADQLRLTPSPFMLQDDIDRNLREISQEIIGLQFEARAAEAQLALMVSQAGGITPEIIAAREEIARIDAAIAQAAGGIVTFADETNGANSEAERLRATLGFTASLSLDGLSAQVAFLAQQLGISADQAARLNAALPGAGPSGSPGLSFGMGGVNTQAFGDFGNVSLGFGNLPSNRRNVENFSTPVVGASGGGGGGGGGSSAQEVTASMRAADQAIRQAQEAAVAFADVQGVLNERLASGAITLETYNSAIEQARERYTEAGSAADFWREQNESLKNGLLDAIVAGDNLSDVFQNLAQSIARAALEAALFGTGPFAGAGGGSGLLGNLFGNIFPRAAGGPVNAGQPYLVGERRPELFVPQTAGRIVPQVSGASAGTTVNVINNTGQQVEQRRSQGPDGRELVEIVVGESIGSGRQDRALSRFGARPQAKVRG